MRLLDIKEIDKEKEEMIWSAFTFLKVCIVCGLYIRTVRACYMRLLDIKETDKEKEEMKWSTFTFLKVCIVCGLYIRTVPSQLHG